MRTYKVVDVFTATPFQGNPVSVGGACVTCVDGTLIS